MAYAFKIQPLPFGVQPIMHITTPKKFFTFLLLIAALLSAGRSWAHGPKYTHIAPTSLIAQDTNGTWTPQDVAMGRYDHLFQKIEDVNPNLNFTTSTYWVKFKITNGNERRSEYYIETARALTNKVNLHEILNVKAKTLYRTGDDYPFSSRPVTYRKFILPIELEATESKEYLLEVGSDGEVLNLPIKLWTQENFHAFVQRENLTLGIYYGLIIFVIGLFLFFATVVRQKIYTYYVSYVTFLFFMQASLDGLAFEYLWPNAPWIANHSILFFSGASVVTLMLYASEFLSINALSNGIKVLYNTTIGLVAISTIASLSTGALYEAQYPFINALSLLALLLIIGVIIYSRLKQKKVDPFFSLGFLAVLAGGIIFILTNFNVIYSDFLNQNAIKLGSALEITFLSMAMVGRYRSIQKEKEAAQKEAFESLEKLNQVTKEQNIILEAQVKERTAEIQEKKEQLEEINEEIIDSITYAKRIQEAILPPRKLVEELLPNAFVLYLPKDIVAGDFYWLEAADDKLFFAAADCTGHGVPGAMVSVVCHNALNRSVREYGLRDPGAILDQTARIVDETFDKSEEEVKDGMDISLCCIDRNTRNISWAGANNPIWIVSKRNDSALGQLSAESMGINLFETKADKQPIGRYPNRENYQTHDFTLGEGDTFYLFSDGYPDQFGGVRGKKYKSKKFKHFLLSIHDAPITEQHDLLKSDFTNWKGELEQIDDVCVIGVKM